jgi:hypothetical protein
MECRVKPGRDGGSCRGAPWFFNQNASATKLMPNAIE